jgi:hypothetical protein
VNFLRKTRLDPTLTEKSLRQIVLGLGLAKNPVSNPTNRRIPSPELNFFIELRAFNILAARA